LVIVDDYSIYTWTHFLRSKDETPEVLIDFLLLALAVLSALRRSSNENKQAWYSIYTVKRLVLAKSKSYYQAFNFKSLFGEITTFHKKLSINQECQDIRSNPSKDKELDIGGKVRELDIGGKVRDLDIGGDC
nr:hypothetical protein [Tanacetum cinerariifolium]